MAHRVLDVVPEHPEIEHVAREVHQAAVQEHRADQRGARGNDRELGRQLRLVEENRRDEAEAVDRSGALACAERGLPEVHQDAGRDQADRDDRRPLGRVVVVDGEHAAWQSAGESRGCRQP
jgi:hypothetical protein